MDGERVGAVARVDALVPAGKVDVTDEAHGARPSRRLVSLVLSVVSCTSHAKLAFGVWFSTLHNGKSEIVVPLRLKRRAAEGH